jgi:hypothetical protein
MLWIIQNSGVTFASLDNNIAPLVSAIDKCGDTRIAVGVIPFTNTIVGMDNLDKNQDIIFYGSTRLVEIAENLSFKPGVFFNKEWFNPKNWIGKRSDLLNEEQKYISAEELRKDWISEAVFIKSIDPKILTGMVLEPEDKSWWISEYEHLDKNDRLVLSPIQKIKQEWRFFIVNNKVITGSQYKHDGVLRIREPISEDIWEQAYKMAGDWLPSKNIVMDIALMEDEKFKVVEFNCLNCSGFYASPIEPLIYEFKKGVKNG